MEITAYWPMEPVAAFPPGNPVHADVRSCRAWIGCVVLFVFCAGLLHAQALSSPPTAPGAPGTQQTDGWWLGSASVYGVYYSLPSGYPNVGNIALGASAQVRYRKSWERSKFALIYSPSYTGPVRYPSWEALNQDLQLSASWDLSPRWKLTSSITGDLSNYQGFLFSPTAYGNVTSISPSAASLSGSVLGQQSTNTDLGMALNSTTLESSIRTLLYGPRVVSATANSSIFYSYSPRLSINFSGTFNRYQGVGGGQQGQQADTPQTPYLIAATTSGSANLGVSYAVSAQTQLGVSVAFGRVVSGLYDFDSATATATLGKSLGRRWSVNLHGGTGFLFPGRTTTIAPATSTTATTTTSIAAPTTPSTAAYPVAGVSLGFRTSAHTFMGSYDFTAGNPYGVGANTTSTSSGSWRWQRPRSPWNLNGSFSWQQLGGAGFGLAASGWRVTAGCGRLVQREISLGAEYAYSRYAGSFAQNTGTGAPALYNESQSAVRLSVSWMSLRPIHH